MRQNLCQTPGKKRGTSAFNTSELETFKKLYDSDRTLNRRCVEQVIATDPGKTIRDVAREPHRKNKGKP